MISRKVVIPGDFLGKGRAGRGAYSEGNKVYAKRVGLLDSKGELLYVIPLSGIYDPKKGDNVIGKIREIGLSKWIVDINSPYQGILPLSEAVDEFVDLTKTDLAKFFNFNDIIFAEILMVSRNKVVQLSMKSKRCRKLRGGRIIEVTPAKVPRIIGKNGSMVETIKKYTNTQIVVGQNGLVWIKGEYEDLAAEAIYEIELRSHIKGLTDKIKQMLEERVSEKGDKNA